MAYGGKLIGIVSFGGDVCTSVPTVFTSVPAYSAWIKKYAVVDM